MTAESRDWHKVEIDEIIQIQTDIVGEAVSFLTLRYAPTDAELADRLLDKNVLGKAHEILENLVYAYSNVRQFDVRDDDRTMAAEARDTAETLKKVADLVRSVPRRQINRYLRNRELPTFLFTPHFYDVFDSAIESFEGWSRSATGRRGRRDVDLAVEYAVEALEILLDRPFKRDLQTAGKQREFVNLDAAFVQQILATLDPGITRANVKSALLNVLSSKK